MIPNLGHLHTGVEICTVPLHQQLKTVIESMGEGEVGGALSIEQALSGCRWVSIKAIKTDLSGSADFQGSQLLPVEFVKEGYTL